MAITRTLIALLVTETAFNQAMMILTVDERYSTVLKLAAIQALAAPLVVIAGQYSGVGMAAFVLGVGRAATSVAAYRVCHRRYGLPYPWTFAGKILAASAGMGAVLVLGRTVWPTSAVEAVTLTVAGTIVFAIGVRLTGAIGTEEIGLPRRVKLPRRPLGAGAPRSPHRSTVSEVARRRITTFQLGLRASMGVHGHEDLGAALRALGHSFELVSTAVGPTNEPVPWKVLAEPAWARGAVGELGAPFFRTPLASRRRAGPGAPLAPGGRDGRRARTRSSPTRRPRRRLWRSPGAGGAAASSSCRAGRT